MLLARNLYLQVLKEITVFKFGDKELTTNYYNGSRVAIFPKIEINLNIGDEIHLLHEGTFLINNEEIINGSLIPPIENINLYKQYNKTDRELKMVEALLLENMINILDQSKSKNVNYFY